MSRFASSARVTRWSAVWLAVSLWFVFVGCTQLRELVALKEVDFHLVRAADFDLAGVRLDDVESMDDVGALDLARLAARVAQRDLPLSFRLDIGALNPADNATQARLVHMDWTLFLEERETISGIFDQTILLPPGEPQTVPLTIELELIEFFDQNLGDLVSLVLSLTGQGGAPRNITLRATPTIDTAIGPIRYPRPVTIISRDVGG